MSKTIEVLIEIIKKNPASVVVVLQMILDILKANPELLIQLVESLTKKNG